MQRRPPEILITTPESLNLLLSSKGGRSLLTGLSTVILDEIHAVLENKRGTHLITAVDRLVPLSGEFQRIALSATVRPIEKAAEFVGGYRMHGSPHEPRYEARPVPIVVSREKKRYEISVKFPEAAGEIKEKENFWHPFVEEIKGIIGRNRSTLIFTNSRRLCEKITHMINLGEGSPIAYAHHGSLSREIRMEVERKLKAGDLRAIVATNSLELGIDIGVLDEVVSVQCPPTISSAIQRIGRAGHRVGEVSRGTLLPSHPMDILEAGVLAAGLLDQDIEPIEPVRSPLDVLAQVIVSMTGLETWDMDLLFAQLKTSYPYRFLDRPQFDLVLQMLAGRYSDSRIQELKPRLSIDRLDNTVGAKKGALQTLYFSGGTIPDRGYFHLRHGRTNAKIGELDEEFVWEAKQGQIFTLGTQNWKIERITHNDVLVSPADPKATAPPFWRAEEALRDFHFSEKIALFLESLDSRWKDSPVDADLLKRYRMDETAARELISFLRRQKEASGGPLPHRHHLPVEFVSAGPGGAPGNQAILHTFWGGRVNRPFALALEAAWEERFGRRPETYVGNECIAVQLPHDLRGEELLSLVKSSTVQDLLKKRLEGSGFFGARFRECAGRALLLPRRKINERMPLWLSRLRSRKLLDAVLDYEDFPILLEAWRVCLRDEFDLESLFRVLTELETGAIAWSEFRTEHPSPMARSVAWQQVNRYVYMDDEPRGGKTSRLSGGLLREVLFSPALRPRASMELIRDFESKRMRLRPGYAPDTSRDLLDWVKERLLLPLSEWESLLDAAERDHHLDRKQLLEPIGRKLVRVLPAGAAEPLIAPREALPRILKALSNGWKEVKVKSFHSRNDVDSLGALPDTEEEASHETALVLGEWLRFYGPRTEGFMARTLGLSPGFSRAPWETSSILKRSSWGN
jgi:ATP-dependent helicase Lhr and Lhr-like helicase